MKQQGTTLSVKFTIQELELLTTLAADQLFRREFIDPKMPGYRANAVEINLAKSLITRLRFLRDRGAVKGQQTVRKAG